MTTLNSTHKGPVNERIEITPHRKFKFGDVVRVPFPFNDGTDASKNRPGVVWRVIETSDWACLWVLMLTKASHKSVGGDMNIGPLIHPTLAPNLSRVIRTCKVATVEATAAEYLTVLTPAEKRALNVVMFHSLRKELMGDIAPSPHQIQAPRRTTSKPGPRGRSHKGRQGHGATP